MSKQEQLLSKALELFNLHGSDQVTTNHIVKALDMSPGNLYYYFKNKKQIICAIFEEMINSWDEELKTEELPKSFTENLEMQIELGAKYYWKYLFIHKELNILIKNDPNFKAIHEKIHHRRLNEFKMMLGYFISEGDLIEMTENTKEFIVDTIWIYSLFWLPYIEVGGNEVTLESIAKVKQHFRELLNPYIRVNTL